MAEMPSAFKLWQILAAPEKGKFKFSTTVLRKPLKESETLSGPESCTDKAVSCKHQRQKNMTI